MRNLIPIKGGDVVRTALCSFCTMLALGISDPDLHAQATPVYSIQSPAASKFATYGKVPVGLYTGVPVISIPLYELEVGSKKLPMSVDYHLSSVKPNQYPGSLGLGWSLTCGGVIMRTIRGVCDEKMTLTHTNGFYGHQSSLQNITEYQFRNATLNNLE